jgi:hypothetical protein
VSEDLLRVLIGHAQTMEGGCPSPKCYENAIRWRAGFREPTL